MSMSPGIYPRHECRTTESEAERRVYTALAAQLPHGWFAWHSLRVRTRDGWEGEGDFVIAVPSTGLLILEVKGGLICVKDGRWFQNDIAMTTAPREQGHSFARLLIERVRSKNCYPPSYGVATCFPDTAFAQPPTQDDVAGCVLGQHDLAWLGEALRSLVERALPPPRPASGNWIAEVHRLWGETWTPRMNLGQKVTFDESERVKLDNHQLALLDLFESNPTVLVEGCAGSGKSLLAREAAVRFAAAGKKVLLLCFTEPLAKWLAEHAAGVKVSPVKRLAAAFMDEAGIPQSTDESTRWSDISLRAAVDALPLLNQNWDAVMIDEAQDFADDDWMLVEELSRGKRVWAFHDPVQAFWPERRIRQDLFQTRLTLPKPYRCPPAIQALAQACVGGPIDEEQLHNAIAAGIIGILECPTTHSIPDKITLEVERLCSGGLKPHDIAILSLRGAAPPDSIAHMTCLGRHALVRADDAGFDRHVVAETFLRFKGLERPAVIVADLHLAKDRLDLGKRLFIAITRSLSVVRIAGTRADLESSGVLKRVFEMQRERHGVPKSFDCNPLQI